MKKIHVYTNNPSPSANEDPLFTVTLTDENLLLLEESIPAAFNSYFPFNLVLTPVSNTKQRFGQVGTHPYYGTYQRVTYENTDFDELSAWANPKTASMGSEVDKSSSVKKFPNGLFSRFFGA